MGRRSKVELAPAEVKALIDAELVRHGFSNYDALELKLRESGHAFSKSGLQRYGVKYAERVTRMKQAAEMAKAARDEIGDDDGAMNSYALSLAQGNMVGVLENLPEGVAVSPAFVRALAVLANASVTQNKALQQYRDKVNSKLAVIEADAVKGTGKKKIDLDTLRYIRESIYGF